MYTSEYYDVMSKSSEEDLSKKWIECSEKDYMYGLEVLPPKRWDGMAFMIGEPLTYGKEGAIFDAFVKVDGKCYSRPAYVSGFDEDKYVQQVKVCLEAI